MPRHPYLHFPLFDVAERHGLDAALLLAERFGGLELEVPQTARPGHAVAQACGLGVWETLVGLADAGKIRNRRVHIPMGPRHPDRIRAAWREGEVRRLTDGGGSERVIATELKISARRVRQIRARLREPRRQGTLDL
jgi:hypothetical protein